MQKTRRKKLVAGNWKMHGSNAFVHNYVQAFVQTAGVPEVDVAIFPPYVYLAALRVALTGSDVGVGAQDVAMESEGAFTGEVSAAMLVDSGCKYTLVGHSERRSLYGESSAVVAAKFDAAQTAGLIPVLCVGETLEEREGNRTLAVVESQLQAVLDQVGRERLVAGVIAYEPVWAIGTGKTASPQQAQEVHGAIRHYLGEQGEQTRILYGGSVKADNAQELFAQVDIDGALVGGASLSPQEFAAICSKAE
jgi:triosephosphate isomerase